MLLLKMSHFLLKMVSQILPFLHSEWLMLLLARLVFELKAFNGKTPMPSDRENGSLQVSISLKENEKPSHDPNEHQLKSM